MGTRVVEEEKEEEEEEGEGEEEEEEGWTHLYPWCGGRPGGCGGGIWRPGEVGGWVGG